MRCRWPTALVLIRKSTVAPFGAAGRTAAAGPVQGRRVRDEVRQAWRMPAGRLGFWVHLTTMTGPVVFATLWGFPYLTQGLGYSTATASGLLMVMVGVGVVANLSIGFVVARRPVVRTPLAIVVIVTCLAAWAVLVGWPGGRPPLAVVVGVIVVLAVGGPASAVAFMLARDYNPRHRISTATGMVNIGGFCGAVVGIFVVGQVLDHVDNGADVHSLAAFRWAFAGLALMTAVALWRLLTWWLRTRAEVLLAAARGEDVPVPIAAHRWELIDEADLIAEAQQAGLTARMITCCGTCSPLKTPLRRRTATSARHDGQVTDRPRRVPTHEPPTCRPVAACCWSTSRAAPPRMMSSAGPGQCCAPAGSATPGRSTRWRPGCWCSPSTGPPGCSDGWRWPPRPTRPPSGSGPTRTPTTPRVQSSGERTPPA